MQKLINKAKSAFTVLEGLLVLGIIFPLILGIIYALSLWTDRNLEYWLSMAKGVPVDVPQWISFLLTLVLNGVILLLNIIGELLRLVF